MKIIETSKEFTKVEKYLMTMDASIKTIKDVADDTVIKVAGYLTFVDEKSDGEVELLSIITPEKEVYTCQSATFKTSFHNIAEIMEGDEFAIRKISGTTKAGRPYVDCALYVE